MLVYNSMFNICRENSFSIPHLFPSLCKIWLEVSKSSKKWQYCRKHEISQVFETLISQILIREDHKWSSYQQSTCQDASFDVWQGGVLNKKFSILRRWIEDNQEDRTKGKQLNFEKVSSNVNLKQSFRILIV